MEDVFGFLVLFGMREMGRKEWIVLLGWMSFLYCSLEEFDLLVFYFFICIKRIIVLGICF